MDKQKKIKIVIVTNDLIIGGVQKLIVDQVTLLNREKFTLSVVSLYQFPGKADFYDLIPSDVSVYKLEFKRFFDLKQWRALVAILRKEKPDIVKSSLFLSNVMVLFLKPFFGYKVISAEHNTDLNRPWHIRMLNRFFSMFTHTIVADSKGVVDIVSKTEGIPKKKFTVIYNGVDTDSIKKYIEENKQKKYEQRREIGLVESDFVFLTIARLATQKNHELMLESFTLFSKEVQNAKLVIVGDGSLRNMLEEKAEKLGIKEKVLFEGEKKDINKYYNIADSFIMTSVREGFCIVAMQALAFGLPVISTKVAGIIEYVKEGENGFFADDEAMSVRDAMLKVYKLTPEERSRFYLDARKTSENYSTASYIEKYEKLFLDCFYS